jgi:hypothetical protein
LTPDRPNKRRQAPPPAWQKAQTTVSRAIRDTCWKQATGLGASFNVVIVTAAKAGENQVLFSPGTPSAWAECARKLIQTTEFPEGKLLSIEPALLPLSWNEQLDTAIAVAEDNCKALISDGNRYFTVAMSGEPGRPVTLAFPSGKAASPELRTCILKAFGSLQSPRALLETHTLRFTDD